jgi:urease accessory protein
MGGMREPEHSKIVHLIGGLLVAMAVLAGRPALAHIVDGSAAGGFLGGFAHPLFGLDHVVAMIAVGLWGAFLGQPAIWVLPIAFPLVMAFGGAMAILGIAVRGVEIGIAISAIALGGMIALAVRARLVPAAMIVAAFAIFHGHAHGAELPPGTDAVAFSVGFVMATGMLHLTGIAFGLLTRWPIGRIGVRVAGIAIALAGAVFLIRAV